MKRILPLLVAVFTINLVTAQQKAPLKNYKIEVAPKSNSVVNNSSSSSSQPAPYGQMIVQILQLGRLLIQVYRHLIGIGLTILIYNLNV